MHLTLDRFGGEYEEIVTQAGWIPARQGGAGRGKSHITNPFLNSHRRGFPQKKQEALFIAPEPINSSDNSRGVFENWEEIY